MMIEQDRTASGKPDEINEEAWFSVTAGSPTARELAALTVTLCAVRASSGTARGAAAGGSRWANRNRNMTGWASASGWGAR